MASTTIPKTMNGVLTEKTGGIEVLDYKTDLPVPELKDGQILVKNDYIGVNFIDTYFRSGLYPSPKPEILGREAAGHIVAARGVSADLHLAVGNPVAYISTGAYAEYTALDATEAYKIPDGIPATYAAASLLQGLTALTLIEGAVTGLKAGDWVLVHAAAGGVGGWLCRLLRAEGVHTVGTASSPAKRETALQSGADVAVGYGEDEVMAAINEKTGGEGVKGVFDGVGASTWETSLKAVGRLGTVASFGSASGAVPPFTIARLSAKNVKICRPTVNNYLTTRPERDYYIGKLWKLMLEAKIDVPIHEIYPLSEIQKAHKDLEARSTMGKLLLKP